MEYNLEVYGISIIKEKDKIIFDNLKWNGVAKKVVLKWVIT